MKQKKGFFAAIAAFILFLAAAGILYGKLSSQVAPEQSIVVENEPGKIEEGQTKESVSEQEKDTAAASDAAKEFAEGAKESADGEKEDTSGETEETPMAPDFTVQDQDGNTVMLSDFRGTPVVLNFWASWCPPCKSEMPEFDQVFTEQDGKVQFLMVNLTDGSRETVDLAKTYIEEQGYSFPVYYDTEQEAAYAYGVSSIPSTYFIDADGKAVARAQGMISKDTLLLGIDMILGDEEAAEDPAKESTGESDTNAK